MALEKLKHYFDQFTADKNGVISSDIQWTGFKAIVVTTN
jgi:hypothetical protein